MIRGAAGAMAARPDGLTDLAPPRARGLATSPQHVDKIEVAGGGLYPVSTAMQSKSGLGIEAQRDRHRRGPQRAPYPHCPRRRMARQHRAEPAGAPTGRVAARAGAMARILTLYGEQSRVDIDKQPCYGIAVQVPSS